MNKKVIVWFRRDLRLHDNTALNKAISYAQSQQLEIIPLFIFDKDILSELDESDKRVAYIHRELELINKELKSYQSCVLWKHSSVMQAFEEVFKCFSITAVFTNEDYEPYAIQRDIEVAELARTNKSEFFSFKDQVIFHKNELLNSSQKPYLVFTPFKNAWLKKLEFIHLKSEALAKNTPFFKHQIELISLSDLGFIKSDIDHPSKELSTALLKSYEETRNIPSLEDGTSKLGVHLRFGTVSIRELVLKCINTTDNNTYLSELIWREFFMYILYHFPDSIHQSFKPKYDRIKWRNNLEEFERWKEGTTGYPLVDAGMRELKTTGYMHNRVRMIVASFLCKHLLIDWRWGEAYFASKLLDYELSSNVGNWQWVSGSGVDAAPYFRIFNPETQLKKFDVKLTYVKKWVPEYFNLNYCSPIVEHKSARERCLNTYKEALQ